MMSGGGRTTTWMFDEVAIEGEDEEGLADTEGGVC
jgi:hypothetical protein